MDTVFLDQTNSIPRFTWPLLVSEIYRAAFYMNIFLSSDMFILDIRTSSFWHCLYSWDIWVSEMLGTHIHSTNTIRVKQGIFV